MAQVPFRRTHIGNRLHHVIFGLQGAANLFRSFSELSYNSLTDSINYLLSKYRLRFEIVLIFNSLACFSRIIKAYALLKPIGFSHLILYFASNSFCT